MLVKLDHFPGQGWTFQKYLSCHHLAASSTLRIPNGFGCVFWTYVWNAGKNVAFFVFLKMTPSGPPLEGKHNMLEWYHLTNTQRKICQFFQAVFFWVPLSALPFFWSPTFRKNMCQNGRRDSLWEIKTKRTDFETTKAKTRKLRCRKKGTISKGDQY